nr:DUF2867 domain-containing protein [Stagnihabitans tardus]
MPQDLAFLHEAAVDLPRPMSPVEAWGRIMADPLPGLALAFRIRDAISARFGVARIGGFSGAPVAAPKVGDRLDFFLVEGEEPGRLTLTARDRHLDVMICVTGGLRLGITASVVTHNRFGRAYMWVVGPAHRLIVRVMLRRLLRGL